MVSAGLSPREAVRRVEARLAAAGCPDADYDARELFRVASGRDARLSDRALTTEEAEKLENLCTRREQREPLQYLCGIWSFLDFDLAVGPGVLCPRADTEVVAEAAACQYPDGHCRAPGAGSLRGNRLSGAGRQALLPGGAGDLRGKKPGSLCLSGKELPLCPEREGRADGGLAGACCL